MKDFMKNLTKLFLFSIIISNVSFLAGLPGPEEQRRLHEDTARQWAKFCAAQKKETLTIEPTERKDEVTKEELAKNRSRKLARELIWWPLSRGQ